MLVELHNKATLAKYTFTGIEHICKLHMNNCSRKNFHNNGSKHPMPLKFATFRNYTINPCHTLMKLMAMDYKHKYL
ncbi:hypothetical protein CAP35_12375 [Chitinophagaceae bacterium IBVUCB1]|nr:hypothetical protein CAP35_12375 [Chitinophagaceae bacterium IBVUCB1]